MPSRRVAFAIALFLVTLTARRAEAGLIPWSYQWNAHPIVINADPLGPDSKPSGGITLTPGAITITGGTPGVALGNASITAVNLTAFTFSPSPNGEPYHFTNSPYSLGVTLTDVASSKSGSLRFSGVFNGSLTTSSEDIQTRFTSATRQSLILGHNLYTVSLTAYTPPGPPSAGGEGSINALVSVQPATVPEPSSLLLAVTGVAAAVVSWRRRTDSPPSRPRRLK